MIYYNKKRLFQRKYVNKKVCTERTLTNTAQFVQRRSLIDKNSAPILLMRENVITNVE